MSYNDCLSTYLINANGSVALFYEDSKFVQQSLEFATCVMKFTVVQVILFIFLVTSVDNVTCLVTVLFVHLLPVALSHQAVVFVCA